MCVRVYLYIYVYLYLYITASTLAAEIQEEFGFVLLHVFIRAFIELIEKLHQRLCQGSFKNVHISYHILPGKIRVTLNAP